MLDSNIYVKEHIQLILTYDYNRNVIPQKKKVVTCLFNTLGLNFTSHCNSKCVLLQSPNKWKLCQTTYRRIDGRLHNTWKTL